MGGPKPFDPNFARWEGGDSISVKAESRPARRLLKETLTHPQYNPSTLKKQYPQDPFELARTIPLLQVVSYYLPTAEPRRQGGRWAIRCPFHEDTTPSCIIFPSETWHCFGCGVGGDGAAFVAALLRIRPLEAAKALCRDFGLTSNWTPQEVKHRFSRSV